MRNIHDVELHGTMLVRTDSDAPTIWNKLAGFDVGRLACVDQHDLTPEQMTELATVTDSMSGYSDADLESMARIGRKAQLALDMRRRSNITSTQVDEACQQTIRR